MACFFLTINIAFDYIISMHITHKNTKIFVQKIGNQNAPTLVFLHGWGCDGTIFLPLVNWLKENYYCVLIDFPPFGKSETPNGAWRLDDYVEIVQKATKQRQVFCLIGHSFGGRVAIRIASCYNKVSKLVLVGSAGLPPRRGIGYYSKIWFYKLFKKFLNSQKHGSQDYKNLPQQMKKTFVNIVNTNQTKECKNIKIPTLIIHGQKDNQTPLWMAKKFCKLIENSKLKIYQNAGHYCFLENQEQFFDDIVLFLKGEI